jgi:hypothetical protein
MSKSLIDRWIICGRSPTSGKLMFYTQAKSFATRGRSMKFASIEKAFARAHKLLREHPQLRGYNLFADKAPATDVTGSHKTLKNPSGYAKIREQYAAEIDRADAKLSGFSGHRATHYQSFKPKPFKVGFALGELVAVEYRATRDGETNNYRHAFKKSSQPLLSVSDDGKQLAILGGEFRVTERGIEDK